MRVSVSKFGRFGTTAAAAVIALSLAVPANANIPTGAPSGSPDFTSSGLADVVFGSGSDTTYTMQQAISDIFNRAPGCALQNTSATADNPQDYTGNCTNYVNGLKSPGFANYDRDTAVERYFLGSGGGRSNVKNWNQGLANTMQADYFRSSSIADDKDVRFIAFAKDALAPFTFDTVKISGSRVDTPAKNIASLKTTEVSGIWQGTIKCWASIDKTVSSIYNTDAWAAFSTDGTNTAILDEAKWQTAATALGAGYGPSTNAYKACVPIAVYTVPTTSGTRTAWDSLAAGGTNKGAAFLSLNDPFTGTAFSTDETSARSISENNASPIAGRLTATDATKLPTTGPAANNTDLVKNAIYFFSVGRYSASVGGPNVSGDPVLSGNSTGLADFSDRLFNIKKADNSTPTANAANIADGSYAFARSLYVGVQYPNQATRNYVDPVFGFLCSPKTENLTDPINSKNVRTEINDAIAAAGFIVLPKDQPGGGRNIAGNVTASAGTSGEKTITVTDSSNLFIGQALTGTGIGTNALVTGISGTTVSVSVANTASVSGTVNYKAVSYCRQDSRSTTDANNDIAVPTVGLDSSTDLTIDTSSSNPKQPAYKVTFSELVSGVVADSSIGLKDASGNIVPSTVTCYNAQLKSISCTPATSTTNYNLAPLAYVKKAVVRPVSDLTAGSTYHVFALGTVGSSVAIQDRHGLVDWPIVAGNALTDFTGADFTIAKDATTLSFKSPVNTVIATKVGTTVAKRKTVLLTSLVNIPAGAGTPTWTITKTRTSGAKFTTTGTGSAQTITITGKGSLTITVTTATSATNEAGALISRVFKATS